MAYQKVPAIAYLHCYTPQGVMEYRTTSFEEVYRFKKVCKEVGFQYAVRYKKVEPEKNTASHIWNRIKNIVKL